LIYPYDQSMNANRSAAFATLLFLGFLAKRDPLIRD